MKKLSYVFMLLIGTLSFAQELDEQDEAFIMERNKTILNVEVKQPFLQVKPSACNNFTEVGLPSGVTSYKDILTKYMYTYLNAEYYTLSGDFTFTLTIDKDGKVTKVEGSPYVRNSEVFFEDMKYIFRRIKEDWQPATCENVPVNSKLKIKISFTSLNADA